MAGLLKAETEKKPEPPPAARQNVILQEHFRKQYSGVFDPNRAQADDRFLNEHVERQIDRFIGDLKRKLKKLKDSLREVEQVQAEILHATGSEPHQQSRMRMREALETMADESEDLRQMVLFVLVGVKSNDDFHPIPREAPQKDGYSQELAYLQEQVENAEKGIHNYFIEPSNTVNLEELRGENMLAFLYRASQMAKWIQRQL
ncbi:MAG: hypothetical protein HY645_04895 [Acidobacteria bacterium]|nr:hypothetical protein [Acidobacteriota bacterium]